MLQSMGSQRVRHDLATTQQQRVHRQVGSQPSPGLHPGPLTRPLCVCGGEFHIFIFSHFRVGAAKVPKRLQGWPYTRLVGTLQAESAEKNRCPLGQNEENKAPPPKTRPGQAQMPSWERA